MTPDYLLYLLIYQAQYTIHRARHNELQKIGITPEESGILFAIHYINAIGSKTTPGEISQRIFREPHSVSALINRMEKRGLVRKARDLDKKTMVRVITTEKGQQAYEQSTKRENSLFNVLTIPRGAPAIRFMLRKVTD
jgi:DNA-binding MarR family transcriptional regulator